jgi:hypothetical protein
MGFPFHKVRKRDMVADKLYKRARVQSLTGRGAGDGDGGRVEPLRHGALRRRKGRQKHAYKVR